MHIPTHQSPQLHPYTSTWFGLVMQPPSFSLVHRGSICINHNAEQMDDTAVALRCPPSSLLVFETAIWAYVPIMSSSDNNQINSSLISALFALIFSNIYRHQSDIYCIYYT